MNLTPWCMRAAALVVAVLIPCSTWAQETGLVGTIRDATDSVLPGVTVTALHVASGTTALSVTDAQGIYRIPVPRPGVYRITAELPGFTTVTQESVELQVGQRATLDFRMSVSTIQENVTVTGESPLLEMRQSRLAGNIDTRQMEELPLNGRNWMQLTVLAPGARVNNAQDAPLGNQAGGYQINMDGQQVTTTWSVASLGSPHFSRDAIAEFQLVSSRFDATQGRSMGIQVNAVTKAGTNQYTGTLSGYFRDDGLNAKDPVLNRVVPFSDQQISGTFGGPIRKDKLHFFANYEYERQPSTIVSNVPYPVFNIPDVPSTQRQDYLGGRVDAVLTPSTRLMVRGSGWTFDQPAVGTSTAHPSTRGYAEQKSGQAFASLLQTKGSLVHELKGGYSGFVTGTGPLVDGNPTFVSMAGGFVIGRSVGHLLGNQHTWSVRDDITMFRGSHELKFGGEFLRPSNRLYYEAGNYGILDATLGPVPANVGELFPVWDDPSTWNLAPLSPLTRSYTLAVGEFEIHCVESPSCRRRKPEAAAWFQDNWTVNSRLTLNLGIRWDFALDGMANDFEFPIDLTYPDLPGIREKQPQQLANFGPRIGGAYSMPDGKTVLRGGWGIYFAGVTDRPSHASFINLANATYQVLNDGRSDFASDPWNEANGGRPPTFEDAQNQARGQLRGTSSIIYNGMNPYSYQTSAGIQRQLGESMAVSADYVWVAGRNEPAARNVNVSFDPSTGVNFPFTDVSKRPYPNYGAINVWTDDGYSDYHALETSLTKRFSRNWQGSMSYTFAATRDRYPEPINPGCSGPVDAGTWTCNSYFSVAPDLGGDYGLKGAGGIQTVTEPDQRHRLVFNGIYQLPYSFQVSGLYLYSSGIRQQVTYGADIRNVGLAEFGAGRLRRDGTVIPRNSVLNDPIHRMDIRFQWSTRAGRVRIDPILEIFNVFDSNNFVRNWTELNPQYGLPIGQTPGNQYRQVQIGFRTTF